MAQSPSPTSAKPRALKLCILGDSGSGKTSLRSSYLDDAFTLGYRATIGADFKTKTVVVDGVSILLSIWDTAGQERFRSLGSSFYRGSDAVLLLYSTTSPSSLLSLRTWLDEFRRRCPVEEEDARDFPWVAVGTKIDLWTEGEAGMVELEEVEKVLAELVGSSKEVEELHGYEVDDGNPRVRISRTEPSSPSHLHPSVDPRHSTIRTTSWATTTESIYHTPSSSLDDSTSTLGDLTLDNDTIQGPSSDEEDDDSPDAMLGQREAEEERRRGVDIFMTSSPPRAPSTLGRANKSCRGHLLQSRLEDSGVESRSAQGIKHFRTSAKNGQGVQEVFDYVIRKARRKWAREDREKELLDAQEEEEARSIELGGKQEKGGLRGACCS